MRRADYHPIEAAAERCLLESQGTAFVGVSGGADSVALLHALSVVAGERRIVAAHCNFGLRGAESDRDEAFVSALCEKLGVERRIIRFDVAAFRKENRGMSVEMACRQLRYEWFEKLMKDAGGGNIFIAHNANDCVETMVLNLMRGSGVSGLAGIRERNGNIIRPLLDFTRREIIEYLNLRRLSHIEDSSNTDTYYKRNFVRNELLPMLENRWPGTFSGLMRSRRALDGDRAIIERVMQDVESHDCLMLDFEKINASAHPVTLLLHFGQKAGVTPEQACEMYDSCKAKTEPGKIWQTSSAIIEKEREGFRISFNAEEEMQELELRKVELRGERLMAMMKEAADSVVFLPHADMSLYEIRTRREGDRINPLGMKGSRLVSKIMHDARLSQWEKRHRRVLVRREDNAIVWVEGLRRSGSDMIDVETSEEVWVLGTASNLDRLFASARETD